MAGVRDGTPARSIGALYGSGASGRSGASASAFEAIATRQAPMVLGVCRRTLDDPHDAFRRKPGR